VLVLAASSPVHFQLLRACALFGLDSSLLIAPKLLDHLTDLGFASAQFSVETSRFFVSTLL
jgi:hypothetical protein